jgi:cell pole-organizing protein PopZ
MRLDNYGLPARSWRVIYGRKILRVLLILCALIILTFNSGYAATAPPGFYLVKSQNGVQLYRKDYPGGAPDFVQVVDLSLGAAVKPLHGAITDPGIGQGVYGGNDARFRSRSLANYWQSFSAENPSAFCITNGQFFYMLEYPTRLPFPLKVDGNLITDGYGIKDFPGKKLILELWPGKADIVPLSNDALLSSSAPDIIAGLTEDAPKRIKFAVGRTFFGVADQNGDSTYDTVLVFNSSISRQEEAANVLRSFGADKVMMLDGGGSTQLSCEGKSYIYSERLIPQAIGIMAAPAGAAVMAEPAPLSPPTRVAITLSVQSAAIAGSDGGALDPISPQPSSTAKTTLAPTPFPTQTEPVQTSIATESEAPANNALPTTPVPAQMLNLTQEQSDIPVLTPTPVGEQPSALSQVQQRENALALLQPQQSVVTESTLKDVGSALQEMPQQADPPVRIVDIVWVPLSMSPVLLILLIMVHKIRGPHI